MTMLRLGRLGDIDLSQAFERSVRWVQRQLDTTELRTNYEPQSGALTGRMLASAAGMAPALSFGCILVGTIVSALLPRLS
jgi:hypothetical protein